MGVTFAIRDDDTCFYTVPDELRRVYADVWRVAPVTLACVPHVSPEADVLAPVASDATDHRSIAEADELVSFLRDRLRAGVADIALHGYDHALYEGAPEFVSAPNLESRIRRGRHTLEGAFDCDVSVFVPPHAQLSARGVRAVSRAGMDVGREYGPKPRELQMDPRWSFTYARMVVFYLRYGHRYRYPTTLDYGTHRELYCHRLADDTSLDWLIEAFEYVAEHDGVFALSTHAPELSSTGVRKLQHIVEYAEDQDASFTTLSRILI